MTRATKAGRVGAGAGALLLVVATFVGLTAPDAGAAGTGSITGVVTAAASGAPLRGICVSAHRTDVNSTLIRTTTTAANGRYTLSNLAPGNVNVQFSDAGFCVGGVPGNLVGKWYDNQLSLRTARPVAVAAGATRANINAALSPGGSITGTVTAAVGGAPLPHICVGAFIPGSEPLLLSSTSTAANGTYRLSGIPGRKVIVEFFTSGTCPGGVVANYVLQWFNGKLTPGTATQVSVAAGATRAGINAGMGVGGTISGIVVTAGAHSTPLFGICVAAYSPGANGVLVGSIGTARNGRYTLRGLPPGDVRVQFNSSGSCPGGILQHFSIQWHSHKPSFATADNVRIVAGTTQPNINGAMIAVLSKPGAPRTVHASKPSPKTAIVTWTAPAANGGTAITGYDATFGGKPVHVSASARRATFANLPKGTYHFRVRAINKVGPGPYSARSNAVNIS